MYQRYKDRAAFLFVYLSEAHPADGWQMDSNEEDEVVFNQPTTIEARRTLATACGARLKLTMPCVVDTLDNHVDTLYAAWPERLYVIGADGRVAYAGGSGPWGYKPEEVERRLQRNVPSR